MSKFRFYFSKNCSDEDDIEWDPEMEDFIESEEDEETDELEINTLPQFEPEENLNFEIDGNKLADDPLYAQKKVEEVMEKNISQKRKRQKKLECVWDLIMGGGDSIPPIDSGLKEDKQGSDQL